MILQANTKAVGSHHIRMIVRGTDVQVLLDGKPPAASTGIWLTYNKVLPNWQDTEIPSLERPFSGKGYIKFRTSTNTSLTVNNLRIRWLSSSND